MSPLPKGHFTAETQSTQRLCFYRATDADPLACLRRGYDVHGVPLCPHGCSLASTAATTSAATAKGYTVSVVFTPPSRTSRRSWENRHPQTAPTWRVSGLLYLMATSGWPATTLWDPPPGSCARAGAATPTTPAPICCANCPTGP